MADDEQNDDLCEYLDVTSQIHADVQAVQDLSREERVHALQACTLSEGCICGITDFSVGASLGADLVTRSLGMDLESGCRRIDATSYCA